MSTLLLPDDGTAADLITYLGRAGRADPGGATRLVARGDVLATYVSPVHGSGAPTVLGLRVLRLAEPADVDVTVPLAALADRFPRLTSSGGLVELPLPPQQAQDASWAGVSPPRAGWQVVGAGSAAVARLRALVWGREVEDIAGVPKGAAFAAQVLGFLGEQEPVALYATGPWRRLTTSRGHVLTRPAPLS